jgi:hypothetical protein
MDRQRIEFRVDALEPQLELKRMLKMISEEFPQEALGVYTCLNPGSSQVEIPNY